jgi:hypothetical protein
MFALQLFAAWKFVFPKAVCHASEKSGGAPINFHDEIGESGKSRLLVGVRF